MKKFCFRFPLYDDSNSPSRPVFKTGHAIRYTRELRVSLFLSIQPCLFSPSLLLLGRLCIPVPQKRFLPFSPVKHVDDREYTCKAPRMLIASYLNPCNLFRGYYLHTLPCNHVITIQSRVDMFDLDIDGLLNVCKFLNGSLALKFKSRKACL